jgi:hypothetical protein
MHDLLPLPLGLAVSLALFAIPGSTPARAYVDPARKIAELRARGPAALDALLAEHDRAAPSQRGPLAEMIDAVAAQRYATTSRLYWYTDLDQARKAARELGRPILALRMLGDLRDDLSCANSRLFRATLYANAEVSALLRSRFVLYWSSERAVPTVTIDFGGGRKIVRTTTGNSAHYVLDENGHVLDVLPGLYASQVFRRELVTSLALADKVRGMSDAQRIRATIEHHRAADSAAIEAWQRVRGLLYTPDGRFLRSTKHALPIVRAEMVTVSKAMMEIPDLEMLGLLRPGELLRDEGVWSEVGRQIWGQSTGELDAAARELVARLHNAEPAAPRAGTAELAEVIARLERGIAADTALNEIRVRPEIRRKIVNHAIPDFATLNAWIYESVFATPKSDPWLGLLPRVDFTGLPGDGVVTP